MTYLPSDHKIRRAVFWRRMRRAAGWAAYVVACFAAGSFIGTYLP